MTPAASESHRLSDDLTIWYRYDPSVKADLFSTSIRTTSGVYLVDPIEPMPKLSAPGNGDKVVGIVVTNGNHERSAPAFADRLLVSIFAHPNAEIPAALHVRDGQQLSPNLTVATIDGAAPGEIVLYWEGETGTLIVGDALVNFGSHGFALLPAKYCSDQKLMRKSLRKLLEFSFTRILFAHGTPIVTNARDRLINLLDEA